MSIDRPSPTHHLDKLEPTSKAWLDYDELVRRDGMISFNPRACKPWPLQCERTPEYAALRDAACHEQQEVQDLRDVIKELAYHQNGLRASAENYSRRLTGDQSRAALYRTAANSLHKFIAKAKFEQDEHQKKYDDLEAKMRAMRQAERDVHRAAHPEDYMVPTIERLEAEGKW